MGDSKNWSRLEFKLVTSFHNFKMKSGNKLTKERKRKMGHLSGNLLPYFDR